MNAWDELVRRCAATRREKLGGLSDQGFEELLRAVREKPADFVDSPAEEAYLVLAKALDAYRADLSDDDMRDDDSYQAARAKRLAALGDACGRALAADPDCLDAKLLALLARDLDPDPLLDGLVALEREVGDPSEEGRLGLDDPTEDPWPNVLLRPRMRLRAAVARCCVAGSRYKMAVSAAETVMDACRTDPLGCRHSAALALARLEDEEGFDALDARFGRQGDSWNRLARTLLLYKLDRMPAARRALRGYDELGQGAAYALLQPMYIDIYMPDRPETKANGFEEALFAVSEAEPIVADVPDFIDWCQGQDWLVASAHRFADEEGLDWEDEEY